MINTSNNISNIVDFYLKQETSGIIKQNLVKEEVEIKASTDVEVEISDTANSELNEIIAKEDELNLNFNTARNIYELLGNIRIEIAGVVKALKNEELKFDTDILNEIDSLSNNLIQKAIDVVKNNDTRGLLNVNLANIYFEGLNSLKVLNLSDDNYYSKLNVLMANVEKKEKEYFDISESLYSDLINISVDIEKKVGVANNSKNIATQIISEPFESISSVASKFSPEIVKSLI